MIDVLIVRDPRESAKKCSLTPLRGRPGIEFRSYYPDRRIDVGRRIWLHPDGALLSRSDAGAGLLLIDSAWRYVRAIRDSLDGELTMRRLPSLITAYPRSSKVFVDPAAGLASVEALYAALVLLGERRPDLLTDYRWADRFLALNPGLAAGSDP